MADVYSPAKRSQVMAAVKSSGTTPETVVLAVVRSLRFRPRLNARDLPGSPDLVFPRRRAVIFVHGCFWHRHHCTSGTATPASNREFWLDKFARNKRRDAAAKKALRKAGWRVMVVWECQTAARRLPKLTRRIHRFLQNALDRPGLSSRNPHVTRRRQPKLKE